MLAIFSQLVKTHVTFIHFMESYKLQILESLATLLLYLMAFFTTKTIINNSLKRTQLERTRRKIIIKAIHLFIFIAVLTLLAGIWGLEQNKIAVCASTMLA